MSEPKFKVGDKVIVKLPGVISEHHEDTPDLYSILLQADSTEVRAYDDEMELIPK